MKVLFICGCTIQNKKLSVASWIQSIICHIDPAIEICIASLFDNQNRETVLEVFGKQVKVFFISSKNIDTEIPEIFHENQCNAAVMFGTENEYAEEIVSAINNAGLTEKTVLFMQGVCGACARHYYEGVPERVAKRYTVRDLLRHDSIIDQKNKMLKKAEREQRILSKIQNVIGRTTMDFSFVKFINPNAHYYKCNDVLRKGFYENVWKYENCNKHTIFISQFYYPLKGFHYLLDAAALLLPKYPDLQIVAAGYNPITKGFNHKEFKDSSYIRYIKKLAKKYSLINHIKLTGILNEEEIIKEYLSCNVFVLPSTIENSPNSLAEAMTLGVPTVAADVGGVSDYASHKEDAFVYPSSEPYLLAHYIDVLFSEPETAVRMGQNAHTRGLRDYNLKINMFQLEKAIKRISE